MIGPFATPDFAHGAYCVAAALQFLAEEVGESATWIPSFTATSKTIALEADFGMFLRPGKFSHLKSPLLVLGECKSFGQFEERDFRRAKLLAEHFPGVVLCFATFRKELTAKEKKRLGAMAKAGRESLGDGQQVNPILVLTRTELFGQFELTLWMVTLNGRNMLDQCSCGER